MHVSGLIIYPVKSLRGISLERSLIDARGLKYDRHWMIVDEENRFRTQRQLPQMARISTGLGKTLILSAEGAGSVEVLLGQSRGRTEVTVWNWTGPADLVSEGADRWLSDVLEMPCRLVAMPNHVHRPTQGGEIAFADAMPVLFAGEASLTSLNSHLDDPVPIDRFRANVIVAGSEPYAEDDWPGINIGGTEFVFGKRCGRCLVTTTDQQTGVRHWGEEPLRTLARERKFGNSACFGAYYLPQNEGGIALGDEIVVA
jgi:hypothetical protein